MTGVIVLTRGAPALCSRRTVDDGTVSGPAPSPAPAAAPAPAPSLQPRMNRRKESKKVLPLIQYRPPLKALKTVHVTQRKSGARTGSSLGLVVTEASDWSLTAEPVAHCFQEMLRGQVVSVSGTNQVRAFVGENRTIWWNDRDEEVALKSRSLAYAEAAAIRAADDAVKAEERLIESKMLAQSRSLPELDHDTSSLPRNRIKTQARRNVKPPRRRQMLRVPVRVTIRRTTRQAPAVGQTIDQPEADSPKVSCLRERRERRRQRQLTTDKFINAMTSVVLKDRCKICPPSHSHTSALHGHARLMEQYAPSLMPTSQRIYDCDDASSCKPRRKARIKTTSKFDDGWLEDYYNELIEPAGEGRSGPNDEPVPSPKTNLNQLASTRQLEQEERACEDSDDLAAPAPIATVTVPEGNKSEHSLEQSLQEGEDSVDYEVDLKLTNQLHQVTRDTY